MLKHLFYLGSNHLSINPDVGSHLWNHLPAVRHLQCEALAGRWHHLAAEHGGMAGASNGKNSGWTPKVGGLTGLINKDPEIKHRNSGFTKKIVCCLRFIPEIVGGTGDNQQFENWKVVGGINLPAAPRFSLEAPPRGLGRLGASCSGKLPSNKSKRECLGSSATVSVRIWYSVCKRYSKVLCLKNTTRRLSEDLRRLFAFLVEHLLVGHITDISSFLLVSMSCLQQILPPPSLVGSSLFLVFEVINLWVSLKVRQVVPKICFPGFAKTWFPKQVSKQRVPQSTKHKKGLWTDLRESAGEVFLHFWAKMIVFSIFSIFPILFGFGSCGEGRSH